MAESEPLLQHHDSSDIHPVYVNHNREQYQPTPLELYRNAIGIGPRTPYYYLAKNPPVGGTFPRGLYKRILNDHWRLQVQYFLFDTLLTTSVIVQLVVGATLTVLGPSAGDHTKAITILGATNTGIAGLLGLLKGNGLPDRLRKDGFELRKVLDYIEAMDAELASGVLLAPEDIDYNSPPASPNLGPSSIDNHLSSKNPTNNGTAHHNELSTLSSRREKERQEVLAIVKQVIQRYETARDTAESNRPESYVSSGVANTPGSPSGRV